MPSYKISSKDFSREILKEPFANQFWSRLKQDEENIQKIYSYFGLSLVITITHLISRLIFLQISANWVRLSFKI